MEAAIETNFYVRIFNVSLCVLRGLSLRPLRFKSLSLRAPRDLRALCVKAF
jgi:hypothetical protein